MPQPTMCPICHTAHPRDPIPTSLLISPDQLKAWLDTLPLAV